MVKSPQAFSDKTGLKASAMIEKLDKLAAERKEFERTDMARTNKKLYELLSNVYKSYEEAASSSAVLKLTVQGLTTILKKHGQRVQQNSTALSLFVRYVFDSERQRIFNYTRAIQAAKASDVKPEQFIEFVTEAGGIEECKAQAKPNEKISEMQQKIAEVMPLVDELLSKDGGQVLASFKVDAKLVDDIKGSGMAFMVGTCDAKGNIKVRSVIPGYSAGFENWAKKKMAQYLQAQKAVSNKKTAQAEQEKAIGEAISTINKAKAGTIKVGELA